MPSSRPPFVAEVMSTLADGQYGPGQEVEILIKYTAPVTVFGAAPRLWLDLGGTDGFAEYDSMNGDTNDTLVFVYVVQEGGYCWENLGRTEESVGPARGVTAC